MDDIVKSQQKIISKQQRTIDRLLTIIENLQSQLIFDTLEDDTEHDSEHVIDFLQLDKDREDEWSFPEEDDKPKRTH